MFHIDANNPDQLLKWMNENLQDDSNSDWHLKSLEEIVSSGKANSHDRAFFEEQFLLSHSYDAKRLFIIECDPCTMTYGKCWTVCCYKSGRNHNSPKGNYPHWIESNGRYIHGDPWPNDDIRYEIYNRWTATNSKYPNLAFSDTINSKHGMNLDEYINSITFTEVYDPRFIPGQYIHGPTQKELSNDYPIYGLIDYHCFDKKLKNIEMRAELLRCRDDLIFYKTELESYIKTGTNRVNWTAGQLLEKWKRIRRQLDVINHELERLSTMTKEYEGSQLLCQFYLTNTGEDMYRKHINDMINSQSVLTIVAFPRTDPRKAWNKVYYERYKRLDEHSIAIFTEEGYEREFMNLWPYKKRNEFIEELRNCESYQLENMITSVIKNRLEGD